MAEKWNVTTKVMDCDITKCTCGFKGYDGHKGADLIPDSTDVTPDILAYADGVVIATGNVNGTNKSTGTAGCGTYVAIKHNDNTITRYQHLQYGSLKVRKGSKVKKGQVIGVYGRPTTGNSTGCHLHFDISLPDKPDCDYIKGTFCDEVRYYVNPNPYLCKTKTATTSSKKMTVTANALNVRSDASMNARVVKVIYKDSVVTVSEQKNGFGKIGNGQWVSLSYVK